MTFDKLEEAIKDLIVSHKAGKKGEMVKADFYLNAALRKLEELRNA